MAAFELTIYLRDSKGNLTGKKKTFESDSAYKIWECWEKHVGSVPVNKHTNSHVPNANEAQKILKTVKYKKPEPKIPE
jgi:hypothetical protein